MASAKTWVQQACTRTVPAAAGREFVAGSYDRTVRIFGFNGGHSREVGLAAGRAWLGHRYGWKNLLIGERAGPTKQAQQAAGEGRAQAPP